MFRPNRETICFKQQTIGRVSDSDTLPCVHDSTSLNFSSRVHSWPPLSPVVSWSLMNRGQERLPQTTSQLPSAYLQQTSSNGCSHKRYPHKKVKTGSRNILWCTERQLCGIIFPRRKKETNSSMRKKADGDVAEKQEAREGFRHRFLFDDLKFISADLQPKAQ